MFDQPNQNQQPNQPTSPQGAPTPPPPVPPAPPTPQAQTGNEKPEPKLPEDIFDDVDKAPNNKEGLPRPILKEVENKTMQQPQVPQQGNEKQAGTSSKKGLKVVIIAIAIIIGIGVIGAAGYYVYNYLQSVPEDVTNTNQANQNVNQNVNQANQNVNQNVNQANQNVNQNTNVPTKPVDTDRDGISDEEEALYGTDPNKVDTDDDGLTDRDEIVTFETDPNNPDTDGDGYGDAEELLSGYDPKGPGELKR